MPAEARSSFTSAEIIAVGSELLTPARVDTNSLVITDRLNEVGIAVSMKAVVGDDRATLAAAFRAALARDSGLVVLTGGLGPTEDDLTRDVVAEVLDLPFDVDTAIVERIRSRFEARGMRMPEINRRQAQVPRGAVVFENRRGTAPGLWLDVGDRAVVLLPGPPREMQPMLEVIVRERLLGRAGGVKVFRRVLKVAGRSESHVEEATQPIYSTWQTGPEAIETTILAAPGQVELHLTTRARSSDEAQSRLQALTVELTTALGPNFFSVDGRSMEQIVGEMLRGRALRLALAESCTGGLAASRITDIPGSSDYFACGIVAYTNEAKSALLGVSPALIAEQGAVSEPVARAMAQGVRERGGADVAIGITGIAGPGGGSERKPVGTVAVSVLGPGDLERTRTFSFPGDRLQVKFQASQAALDGLRRVLLDDAGGR